MNYGIALEMREAALSSVKWAIQSRLVGKELPAWIDTAQGLLLSRPVFWSSECAGAVAAAAPSFDLSEITCERHLLFTDCAFVWFEHPFMTMLSGGEEVPVVALQWQCEQHETTGRPQLTMVNYAGTRKGPLPLMWSTTTFGDAMTPALGGEAGLQVTEEFASEQVAWKKWLVAANAFIRQRLLEDAAVKAERSFRRRLPAEVVDQPISVIKLRAVDRSSAPNAPTGREWQHQWLVAGHVRRQWYPTLGEHLPVWISPYIKGPDDKPFKKRTEPLIVVNR